MQILFSLLTEAPHIELPSQWPGWLGWFFLLVITSWLIWRFWEKPEIQTRSRWLLFWMLFALVPITSLFIGIKLPFTLGQIPLLDDPKPILLILSALPWMIAALTVGTVPSIGMAFLSGLILGFWETHSLFTMLEVTALALVFCITTRQNYRSFVFNFVRHPAGSAVLLVLANIPLMVLTAFFNTNGTLAARLDASLAMTWPWLLSRSLELLAAGLGCEGIFFLRRRHKENQPSLVPSPISKSLSLRFFAWIIPLLIGMLLILMMNIWAVAARTARSMVNDKLEGPARIAAESLADFHETGRDLAQFIASPDLPAMTAENAGEKLTRQLEATRFFKSLYLIDSHGNPVNGAPISDYDKLHVTGEEKAGIELALRGVPLQTYTLPANSGEGVAQFSFIVAIFDQTQSVQGVILGRADFYTNRVTNPTITALENASSEGGEVLILDEKDRILFNSAGVNILDVDGGTLPERSGLFEEIGRDGNRRVIYNQPVPGRSWAILLSVPIDQVQQLTLRMAAPYFLLVTVFCGLLLLSLWLSFNKATHTLRAMAQEATLISQGLLDKSLSTTSDDEVGEFGRAFEKMRLSLRARLEDLGHFLQVSQGVASNLQVEKAVPPILQAAKFDDASAVRIVLIKEVTLEKDHGMLVSFGLGEKADSYRHLDQQLFELTNQRDAFTIPNLSRTRRMVFDASLLKPGALISLPIRQENVYYGALWVGFDEPRNFTEDEVKYLGTLADQAAIAATNAKLYATSEIGRQRLEAVLASTPEPVLVIDEFSRLSILNPAALQVPGLIANSQPGSLVKDAILNSQLLDLILSTADDRLSTREINFPGDRIYAASVSPVIVENKSVGLICMLRDITHYKHLDTLKSDFVSTVSHDLRSPLTLMRGYATMMQMVGDLNEQQKVYAEKIVTGIENMSRLVTNLLDLGRIEAGIGLQIERVSANEILEEVVNSLQPQAVQKNIRVKQEITTDIPTMPDIYVEVDRALMQQALFNLVENGIKYTRVGGQIELRLASHNGFVIFEVKDTGIGVAPLDLPHMFEKFYRSGRREAFVDRGSGLGLTIVKSIVDRHGGKVWVESQLGKGSAFFIEIPARHIEKNQIK